MERLLEKIDELITAINKGTVPLWLSVFGIFVPILISIAVAVIACIQHNSNKKLQTYISEKETRVQMHSDFLTIYDSFSMVHKTILLRENQIKEIFAIPNLTFQWHNDIRQALSGICQATNRARLILPSHDTDLISVLTTVLEKFSVLVSEVDEYVFSGKNEGDRGVAWGKLNPYYGISYGNYMILSSNSEAYQDFIKLYNDDKTNNIKQKIETLLPLFEYEKFDKFFEPYLRMDVKENKR